MLMLLRGSRIEKAMVQLTVQIRPQRLKCLSEKHLHTSIPTRLENIVGSFLTEVPFPVISQNFTCYRADA